MKLAVSMALGAAMTFTGPVLAQDVTKATTEADCEKAGGKWNPQSGDCAEDSAKMGKGEGTHTGEHATPEHDTQKIDQPERRNPTTGN